VRFLVNATTVLGVAWTILLLVRKARSPSRLRRRAVRPVLIASIVLAFLEALQNAAKHAGAGADVTINLAPHRDGIAFAIADDGAGFDADTESTGLGLLNMRDRIDALGGQLDIVSVTGHGTTVHGVVPVPGAVTGTG
jgi:signal transduction histidine kinase